MKKLIVKKDLEKDARILRELLISQVANKSYKDENGNIIIGEFLELHFSEDGENLDIYQYVPQEVMEADEDYDFDADYITTINLK